MAEKKITIRKAAAVIAGALLIIIAAAVAYLSLVPIDLTPHLPRVKEMMEKRVAGQVEIERLVVKALPSPDITAEGVSTTMEGSPIFGARRVRVRVSLLPLIIGHVVLEDIELDGANIFLRRDENGVVNVLEFLKASREVRERNGSRRSLAVKLMNITDTQVEITDRLPEEPVEFEITGIKGIIKMTGEGLVMEAGARLAPDTRFTFSGKETREGMKGEGSLRGLRLERFSPYLREAFKGASMEGAVDFDFTYSGKRDKKLEGTLAYGSLSIDLPEILTRPLASNAGSARVSLAPDGRGLALAVNDINLDLGGFGVKGEFSLSGARGERAFALELSTTPVPLGDAARLVRAEALPGAYAEKLASLEPLKGTVAIRKLSASGPVKPSGKPMESLAIGLDAAIEGASFNYRGLKKPFEDISASVSYSGKALKVSGAGRYGKEVIEGLEATVSGLSGKPAYDVSVKASLDLNESVGLASGLAKKNKAASEMLSSADFQGAASLTAKAKGDFKGGLSSAIYSGKMQLRNGELSYRGFPLKLKSISATAGFDNKAIEIKELKASEGDSSLSLSGTVRDYLGKDPSFNITAEGRAAAATLTRAAAGRPLGKEAEFKGHIPYAIKAQGSIGSFIADASIDARPAYIRYRDIIEKRAGVNLSLNISAGLTGKSVDIRKAVLNFSEGSAMNASGKAASDMSAYDLTIASGKIMFADMDEVSPYFSKDFESGGLISFKVSAVKGSAKASPSFSGEASVRDARFQTRSIAKPVEDIDASARFTGNKAEITLENLSVGRTKAKGFIDIQDIAQRTVRFELSSPGLYTGDLMPKREGKGEPKKPETKKAEKKPPARPEEESGPALNGYGTIRITGGELFGHPFRDLRADINIDKLAARAEPVEMSIDQGKATGRLVFYKSPSAPRLFESGFTMKGIDIKTMLDGFGAKKEYLTGTFGADIELSGERGATPFTAGLNGKASFRAVKGRMWKIPVLTEIFSIVNILSIDELWKKGLPYKTIAGDFTMKGGAAATENIEMDSDSMRMSAAGEIHLPESKMDMVVALRPFVTIDKIISNIPLAGWLITGEDESTVSMYFGVKGPLKSPTVLPKPITGISKGVFGILQRILEAPVEILRGEMPGAEEKEKTP